MNHKIDYVQIARDFANELAARYDLPELRGAFFTLRDSMTVKGDRCVSMETVPALPTGQLAGIVKSLTVKVEVYFEAESGYVGGTLSYRYRHHGGGGNGADQQFALVLDGKYAERTYDGCISRDILHTYQRNIQTK